MTLKCLQFIKLSVGNLLFAQTVIHYHATQYTGCDLAAQSSKISIVGIGGLPYGSALHPVNGGSG